MVRAARSTALLLALAAGLAACPGSKGEAVIGVVGPLSGPLAFVGDQQRRGAEIAADEINRAGGIAGRKVRIAVRDDADFSRITGILRDLSLRAGALAIIGPETATPVLGSSSPTARAKVPVLLPYAAHGDLARSPGVFRLVPAAADQAAVLAEWLVKERGIGKIAVASSSDEDGRGGLALLRQAIVASGGTVAGSREFAVGDVDQTGVAQALRASGAGAVVVWGPPADASRVATAVRRIGWGVQLAGPIGLFVSDYRSLAGADSDGTAITLPFRKDWFSARVAAFFLAYQSKFGIVTIPRQRTLIPDLPIVAMASYDAVKLVAEAARRSGASAAGVTRGLQGLKDFQGVGTSYSFSPSKREAFVRDELWMARFYNFALLYDVDRRADRNEQIAFYKIQTSAVYLPSEFFQTDKGAELQQRILEDVLTNPEQVQFFKDYMAPRPPPGPV